ncbi:MAG: UDP-3-O-[3-hydroxymyristoyl] N-acetylglucosamine deacetylase [Bacteroidales bacterium]|nr:UDP-3-O-[3-hydroxymyristoyl] N-acetylglucosamine deacetylase [Bacteroidales bacterium]
MQHTIKRPYTFTGKGLHTGVISTMTLLPAPAGCGIVFRRTDIGPEATVRALATNVGDTSRSTALEENGASVCTVEHLLSAAAALGIDNMLVELNAPEAPILDGSALPYVQAICTDSLEQQDAPRRVLTLTGPYHYEDGSGAVIDILPSPAARMELTVDFNSKVLGVQRFVYDGSVDYATQIAPCRTFCFFHELEFLASKGLIKGGDVENAIVIVEHPVDAATLERMEALFGVGGLEVREGYLNNLQLHFPDEIVRHKMLDMIGDFSLLGAPLQGTIIASKTGHRANTAAARALLQSNLLKR